MKNILSKFFRYLDIWMFRANLALQLQFWPTPYRAVLMYLTAEFSPYNSEAGLDQNTGLKYRVWT